MVGMKTHARNVYSLINSADERTSLKEQDCSKESPLALKEGCSLIDQLKETTQHHTSRKIYFQKRDLEVDNQDARGVGALKRPKQRGCQRTRAKGRGNKTGEASY
jgi:hypothetical protein